MSVTSAEEGKACDMVSVRLSVCWRTNSSESYKRIFMEFCGRVGHDQGGTGYILVAIRSPFCGFWVTIHDSSPLGNTCVVWSGSLQCILGSASYQQALMKVNVGVLSDSRTTQSCFFRPVAAPFSVEVCAVQALIF